MTIGSSTSPPAIVSISLNAKTGQPIPTFGDKGVIDLKVGVMVYDNKTGKQIQADLEKSEIGLHAVPTHRQRHGDRADRRCSRASVISTAPTSRASSRAFDIRTGKQLWRFDTMPGPGQPGHETWENGSWDWTGNTGVWTHITVDPEAGLVYLPVETPTIDEYGGNRPRRQSLCGEPGRG